MSQESNVLKVKEVHQRDGQVKTRPETSLVALEKSAHPQCFGVTEAGNKNGRR